MGDHTSIKQRWAQFRFSLIGGLLAAPPAPGQLQEELQRLSEKAWEHPITKRSVSFARSTLERWYYAALATNDPLSALRRHPRRDRGRIRTMPAAIAELVRAQYQAHPTWSYQLHRDNLAALLSEKPELGRLPSYSTLRRFMIAHGLPKQRRVRSRSAMSSSSSFSSGPARERRSFEAEYVGGLWHLDFHHGSRKILSPRGDWQVPILLAILDDHSRLACHTQWYLQETAECLIHGLLQALIKRGLCRALLTDNGSAMIAGETTEGLARLSVLHRTTLPHSPYQNGKQEVFFAQVESRLLAMLEGHADLDLGLLNEATLAWVEMDYHRRVHSETGQTPLERFLSGPSVARPCPSLDDLHLAFTATQQRTQRQSDSTISLAGTRFEIPQRFSHLKRITVRFKSWDKSHVFLVDENTGVVLDRLYPIDKAKNASGLRRPLRPQAIAEARTKEVPESGIAPLLKQHMAEYAATGLPPAYIKKETP
ncbi:MAG: DDE-type integrase/transposase/recombinase [Acidimicrobiia bacterium]|nr:DDE-type integrase/transposase/recombinase [Acidimicrobiia bacterium]